mgnify:FL=1|tara:strand:+ start:150 stop:488 length:339 start_codon:yes stop_codon:yes gene_type:complete
MTEQTDRLIAEIEKERTSERASIDFKFHYNTIGDCFYDIYCQPNYTKKEDLLKDMARILNGELTPEDFKTEILQWVSERSDECYLDEDCQIRRFDEVKRGSVSVPIAKQGSS